MLIAHVSAIFVDSLLPKTRNIPIKFVELRLVELSSWTAAIPYIDELANWS